MSVVVGMDDRIRCALCGCLRDNHAAGAKGKAMQCLVCSCPAFVEKS